jgi:tRNA-specific 2-thiouridylase
MADKRSHGGAREQNRAEPAVKEKALIAMSGGVDSSVAAWLMAGGGYDCTGAMMKLFTGAGPEPESGCCSALDAGDARAVAFQLGIPFYVFNFAESFAVQVIERFVSAYKAGMTPNPCIDCNRYLKFERFLNRARDIGCDCIATGHYARIEAGAKGGRLLLKKGVDEAKDQSYVLYAMTQRQLKRTRFPLGGLSKSQVREIAREHGFVNAAKRDSQDICFVPNGDYAAFIDSRGGTVPQRGFFLDTKGGVLGEHGGIHRYTVGQRRGLGLQAGEALYVCAVCPRSNTVVVGPQEALHAKALLARDINLIPVERLDAPLRVRAKIRYRQAGQPATVWQLDADTLRVEFDSPQRAITGGQAVVLYDGDVVVGGGTIAQSAPPGGDG